MKLSNSQRQQMFNVLPSVAFNFCYLASCDRSQVALAAWNVDILYERFN